MLYFQLSESQISKLADQCNEKEATELKTFEKRVPIKFVLRVAKEIKPFISRLECDVPTYPKSKFEYLRTVNTESEMIKDKKIFMGLGNCGFTSASVFIAAWYACGNMESGQKTLISLLLCMLVLFAELFLFFRYVQQAENKSA